MKPQALVAYASRAGSTAEIARSIGEILAGRGYAVDVRPVKETISAGGYQAVIVGSAVRMGAWLPEAVEFVRANRGRLSQIPTAFFTVHMLNRGEDAAARQARDAYTASVRAILAPQEEVFFAGRLDPDRLAFLDRLITTFVGGKTGAATGDLRDWEQIDGWARKIFA